MQFLQQGTGISRQKIYDCLILGILRSVLPEAVRDFPDLLPYPPCLIHIGGIESEFVKKEMIEVVKVI
jgi:hypothetical protein